MTVTVSVTAAVSVTVAVSVAATVTVPVTACGISRIHRGCVMAHSIART